MGVSILRGDCRERLAELPAESVHCIVTSPPYFGLRDYGVAGQIGLEETPDAFVAELVAVFRECRRVLRSDGTLWLNLGDSYAGSWGAQGRHDRVGKDILRTGMSATQIDAHPKRLTQTGSIRQPGLKPKDLIGIPWRVAFELQADGWWLRQDIIWSKPNPMPESVTDRCTKAHEYLFLLSKSERYFYDAAAVSEPGTNRPSGNRASDKHIAAALTDPKARTKANLHKIPPSDTRNRRSVWTVPTHSFTGAHFATFPPALIEPCILAGCPEGGTVLDPFGGAGTTGLVAGRLGRNAILIELNPNYADMAARRIADDDPLFGKVSILEATGAPR